jgi:hypothetical protein
MQKEMKVTTFVAENPYGEKTYSVIIGEGTKEQRVVMTSGKSTIEKIEKLMTTQEKPKDEKGGKKQLA